MKKLATFGVAAALTMASFIPTTAVSAHSEIDSYSVPTLSELAEILDEIQEQLDEIDVEKVADVLNTAHSLENAMDALSEKGYDTLADAQAAIASVRGDKAVNDLIDAMEDYSEDTVSGYVDLKEIVSDYLGHEASDEEIVETVKAAQAVSEEDVLSETEEDLIEALEGIDAKAALSKVDALEELILAEDDGADVNSATDVAKGAKTLSSFYNGMIEQDKGTDAMQAYLDAYEALGGDDLADDIIAAEAAINAYADAENVDADVEEILAIAEDAAARKDDSDLKKAVDVDDDVDAQKIVDDYNDAHDIAVDFDPEEATDGKMTPSQVKSLINTVKNVYQKSDVSDEDAELVDLVKAAEAAQKDYDDKGLTDETVEEAEDLAAEQLDLMLAQGYFQQMYNEEALYDYTVIAGDKQTFEGGNGLQIRFNGNYNLFEELRVNDEVLNEEYYTVEEGSTVITLSAAYLNSLAAGTYTVTAVYRGGNTAEGTFYIAATTPDTSGFVEKITTEANASLAFAAAIATGAAIVVRRKAVRE